jgi:hypothetical protein
MKVFLKGDNTSKCMEAEQCVKQVRKQQIAHSGWSAGWEPEGHTDK